MPKLPQHIEVRYKSELASEAYHIFNELNGRPEESHKYYDVEIKIKSFIATILNEERTRLIHKIENMAIETVGNSAKTVDQIINLIKEDEKNNL